ncbi:MAG: hypothetical protein WCC90_15405, partial [Methylocella sp.]
REDFWLIVAFQGAKMRQKSGPVKEPAEKVVKDIRRATRRQFSESFAIIGKNDDIGLLDCRKSGFDDTYLDRCFQG